MNHWSVRQMQGKPKMKNLKNKTSVLIPIGSPAEALTHYPTKVTKVKIPTRNPLVVP